jgi:hypothetical protein
MELFGQHGHVDDAGALSSEGCGHQAAQEASLDHLLIERPRGCETLQRGR